MISCRQYDYIEIACLYHLEIQLTLINGDLLSGVAITTRYNQNRQECLVIKNNKLELLVPTEQLKTMRAMQKNQHFDLIVFDELTE